MGGGNCSLCPGCPMGKGRPWPLGIISNYDQGHICSGEWSESYLLLVLKLNCIALNLNSVYTQLALSIPI
jgi:hypothetical protein